MGFVESVLDIEGKFDNLECLGKLQALQCLGSVAPGMLRTCARFGAARVRQVSPLVTMKSMSTTTSAGPLKSLGRIGQVKW